MNQKSTLKTPTLVYILGICFILAPIGNVFVSLYTAGYWKYLSLSLFGKAVQSIPMIDIVWMILICISGFALFIKHKLTWSLAIFTLAAITILNIYKILFQPHQSELTHIHHIVNIFATLSVLTIVYYFRFPYLDRRMTWRGFAPRFAVKIPTQVKQFSGTMDSISNTGAKIVLDLAPSDAFNIMDKVEINFANIHLEAEVVDWSNSSLRVKFLNVNKASRRQIEDVILFEIEK